MSDYRTPLVEALGGFCKRCGEESYLEIHHKDRDRSNNTMDNLELLCEECHNEEHARETTEILPPEMASEIEPREIRKKTVNNSGQVHLGREFGGKKVIVAYEVIDRE